MAKKRPKRTKRKTAKPGVSARVKEKLAGLVAVAGAGRKDLAWLDEAIREAGYLPVAEAVTEKDLEAAMARVERIMQTVAAPAEAITGREWRERVTKAFQEAEGG